MSYHAFEKWRLCQIIYEGVDYQSKTLLESTSHEKFMMMIEDDAWKFSEDMAEKTNAVGGIYRNIFNHNSYIKG